MYHSEGSFTDFDITLRLSRLTSLIIALACIAGSGTLPVSAFAQDAGIQNEHLEVSRHAVGFPFAERENLPHGVAADAHHVFVTEPLNGRVVAISRRTGKEVAELPPPRTDEYA
jgi:hypothetical protein